MNEKKYSTLGLIALILQGIGVLGTICIILFQRALLPIVVNIVPEYKGFIVPIEAMFMVFELVIYLVFYLHSSRDDNYALVIVLMALYVFLSFVSFFASRMGVMVYARLGESNLVAYSGVSNLINFMSIFTLPAAPLFFIAGGRYTARKGA